MRLPFLALFILGLGMLVRGLMTVSWSRAGWMAGSVAATAVHLSEQFGGTELPAALIVFGGVLVLMSFALVTG